MLCSPRIAITSLFGHMYRTKFQAIVAYFDPTFYVAVHISVILVKGLVLSGNSMWPIHTTYIKWRNSSLFKKKILEYIQTRPITAYFILWDKRKQGRIFKGIVRQ